MNNFHEKFGFLFEIVKDRVTDDETNDSALRTQCLNLQTLLSWQTECEIASSDIDGLALFDELKTLHNISIIPEDIDIELLRFYTRIVCMRFSQMLRLLCVLCLLFQSPLLQVSGVFQH